MHTGMKPDPDILDARRTTNDFAEANPSMALLPLGATEQHGAHLPVGTDTFQIDYLADEIAKRMPIFAFILVLTAFASIGLPGLGGFVGEFLILIGSFQQNRLLTALATLGVLFGAVYMLSMVRRVLFGPLTSAENEKLQDLDPREWALLAPIVVMYFWIGCYPATFLDKVRPTLDVISQIVEGSR